MIFLHMIKKYPGILSKCEENCHRQQIWIESDLRAILLACDSEET